MTNRRFGLMYGYKTSKREGYGIIQSFIGSLVAYVFIIASIEHENWDGREVTIDE